MSTRRFKVEALVPFAFAPQTVLYELCTNLLPVEHLFVPIRFRSCGMTCQRAKTPHFSDVYAKELARYEIGHPMWGPDQSVSLYDVGYLENGFFIFLFNAAADPGNTEIQKRGAPAGHMPFSPRPGSDRVIPNYITSPVLHGESVQNVRLSAEGSASGGLAHATVGVHFDCQRASGALLMVRGGVHRHVILCKKYLKEYLKANISSWLEFANSELQCGIEESDIVFVYGTTTTAAWITTSFHHSTFNTEVKISGACAYPVASSGVSIQFSSEHHATVDHRHGPMNLFPRWNELDQAQIRPEDCDQCIFLEYYRMKRRFGFIKRIEAAAGPYELPPDRSPSPDASLPGHEDAEIISEREWLIQQYGISTAKENGDAIDALLSYVLEHSDADIAIVSDTDLLDLFEGRPIPMEDLEGALSVLQPHIVEEASSGGITTAYVMCATSRPFQKEILEHEQRSRVDPDAENLTGGKPSRIDTTPTPRVLPGVGEENGAWEGVYLRSGRTIADTRDTICAGSRAFSCMI